jgi:hypothetical protein
MLRRVKFDGCIPIRSGGNLAAARSVLVYLVDMIEADSQELLDRGKEEKKAGQQRTMIFPRLPRFNAEQLCKTALLHRKALSHGFRRRSKPLTTSGRSATLLSELGLQKQLPPAWSSVGKGPIFAEHVCRSHCQQAVGRLYRYSVGPRDDTCILPIASQFSELSSLLMIGRIIPLSRGILNGGPSLGRVEAVADGVHVLIASQMNDGNKHCIWSKRPCALSGEEFSIWITR